jgi:hypothetical protein
VLEQLDESWWVGGFSMESLCCRGWAEDIETDKNLGAIGSMSRH